jgi:acyl-CoA synthetase (NDP forming)
MEAIKDRDRFIDAVARARVSGKPVIAMKVGGSTVGAAAAASHTASLAGSDAVYDAAFRQLGVERAVSPEDVIEIAYACTRGRLPRSRRLAVITVSGGAELEPLVDQLRLIERLCRQIDRVAGRRERHPAEHVRLRLSR